jgi:hypothetical protein
MLLAHEQMFGPAGRQAAELVLRRAPTLFTVPLDALNIRVVLAPVELGPYNRHTGYCAGTAGDATFILGNRHIVELGHGTLVLVQNLQGLEDFIVHELTHQRQQQLLQEHANDPAWRKTRGGKHRDLGWYAAIAEAAPKYLGVSFPESSWPTGPRSHQRERNPTFSEKEATHWPDSFRHLRTREDQRLPKVAKAAAHPL